MKRNSAQRQSPGPGRTLWRLVILILCVFVMAALFADVAFDLPLEVSRLLSHVDVFVCLIFLGDFFYNLLTAEKKLSYFLRWGWLDLLSSLPNLRLLRWGRLARLLRILWLIRGFRSFKELFAQAYRNRTQGSLVTVALLAFLLVVFAAIAVLLCETGPGANLKTAADALWWACVTITTVGYGDFYPVSTCGRLVALALMTAGVGLFGTSTAFIATLFLQPGGDSSSAAKIAVKPVGDPRLDELQTELQLIRESLENLERRERLEKRD
ncbi:MAG: potassium channel family protein [Deltaproteobacteria bacterium]|nr:potassium channel family protein [Deltaproteobacteria bacterium]